MAKRLFETCLEIVARNICLVESFVDFPDLIGKQVFDAADAACRLDPGVMAPVESQQVLRVFTAAYAEHVLSDLNVAGQHLMLANCLENLMLFSNLRTLDVSSCCLGDEHELLFHVSTLESLDKLLFRDNALTDRGIQKWTAPIRIKKTGPTKLTILDLSENEGVSARSLKFLHVFSQLQLLNLSSTSVRQGPEVQHLAERRCLKVCCTLPQLQCGGVADLLKVTTQGWAKATIDRWIQNARRPARPTIPPSVASRGKAGRFYGRGRMRDKPPSASPCVPARSKRFREPCDLSLVLVHRSLLAVSAPLGSLTTTLPLCAEDTLVCENAGAALPHLNKSATGVTAHDSQKQSVNAPRAVMAHDSRKLDASQAVACDSRKLTSRTVGHDSRVTSSSAAQIMTHGSRTVNLHPSLPESKYGGPKSAGVYLQTERISQQSQAPGDSSGWGCSGDQNMLLCTLSLKKNINLALPSQDKKGCLDTDQGIAVRVSDRETRGSDAVEEGTKKTRGVRGLSEEELLILGQYAS